MSKYAELFTYLRQCPQLNDLWSIAANEEAGVNVVLPQGSSEAVQYDEGFDNLGGYVCDIIPYPSVFDDFQINCFKDYDVGDESLPASNINVMNLDDVQSVCDWIAEQNRNGNLPLITGEKVVSIECNPRVPQIRYVDDEKGLIAYFITVRVRYVNKEPQRTVEFDK